MIRQAKPKDAKDVVEILLQIFDEMDITVLRPIPREKLTAMLVAAFQNPKYRYSYHYTMVYQDDNDNIIKGIVNGYPHDDEATIDDALVPYLQIAGLPEDTRLFSNDESMEDEWYLDSFAVHPDYQGQGIGSMLLDYLPQHLKKIGVSESKISLSCDLENPRAKKLYLRKGFKEDGYVMIDTHKYDHMIKKI